MKEYYKREKREMWWILLLIWCRLLQRNMAPGARVVVSQLQQSVFLVFSLDCAWAGA